MLWNPNTSPFSPLSSKKVREEQNESLLLTFLLSALLNAHQAFVKKEPFEKILSPHARCLPYDWGYAHGYLNKAQEHTLLLHAGFPLHLKYIAAFEKRLFQWVYSLAQKKKTPKNFEKEMKKLFLLLEPLIAACINNENLVLFLLKNRQEIDELMKNAYLIGLLNKFHPDGLETMAERMCDRFHKRGFFSTIPEIKLLLTEMEGAYA